MKLIHILLLAVMVAFGMTPALATVTIAKTNYFPNYKLDSIVTLTSAYANTTATPSDITGLTYTVPATAGDYTKQYFEICYWADATKSTSTTGSITVNISGSDDTASSHFIASSAGRGTIANCYTIARATASAVIIKLRGVSADTANFAITTAQMRVGRYILN